MKRFTILLMAVVAVIAMAACGGTSKKDKSPKEIVKAYYQHMVDGDFEKALSYTNASEGASSSTIAKSLRIQSTAKPKSNCPCSMVRLRLSICQLCAAPLSMAARTVGMSSPAISPNAMASLSPCTRPAMQIWFTILAN